MENLPKKSSLRATTRLACQIANVNADRLNEAVHAGFYPCAPKTTPGKARTYDVDDIVALRLYQEAMSDGMNAAGAGRKACAVREFMAQHPSASHVYIVGTSFKSIDRLLPDFDVRSDEIKINSTQPVDVTRCEVINLDWHRVRIVHYLTEAHHEALTRVGEAD